MVDRPLRWPLAIQSAMSLQEGSAMSTNTLVIVNAAVTQDVRYPENNPLKYRRRILAEGDSWFSLSGYPKIENVLFELDFNPGTEEKTLIVNIAKPGDEIVRMASPEHVKVFENLVRVSKHAYGWSLILLSGGGNDLIAAAGKILRKGDSVEACIVQAELTACMNNVQAAYRKLAAIRDAATGINDDCVMVTHTYDYATPRDSPTRFFGGTIGRSWLHEAMEKKGIPQQFRIPIADRLIDTLAETIIGLTKGTNPIRKFVVVPTRGTLIRAAEGDTDTSNDWRNEIHPTSDGYAKIARKVEPVVTAHWVRKTP
jgi:lysophospholipase L1-like esterase